MHPKTRWKGVCYIIMTGDREGEEIGEIEKEVVTYVRQAKTMWKGDGYIIRC